ncbi:MAG: ATP-grasp domain-containing protein [Fibrobacter sp.]|nr:ATP-grasp domain-containing protein [Fibrobacter sp.]
MADKKVALVLGGTVPHISLVKKLKDRGFYVILLDYLDNPPAKQYADEHIKESTLDKDAVLTIAKIRNAQLVISTCIDQANSTCCYVAEKLGLAHPYSYQTSLDVTDKGRMKKIMCEKGIPTSSYTLVKSIEEINWSEISFPAVVKPVDCNSSKGVHRVDSQEETKNRVQEALELSRTKTAIIEGYNQGFEIQVDCVSTSDGVKVALTRQKQKIIGQEHSMVLQSYGSIFPAPLSDALSQQAQEIAKKIADAFDLKNTPFFYQAIVTKNGIQVLEFAPRIGGGLSYYVLKAFANYDAVECAIDSFMGIDISVTPTKQELMHSTNIIYMKPGVFDHIEGLEEQKEKGNLSEFFISKEKGSVVDADMRSSNRIASFIVEGFSYEEIAKKAATVFSKIKVLDPNGISLLNKSIYPLV